MYNSSLPAASMNHEHDTMTESLCTNILCAGFEIVKWIFVVFQRLHAFSLIRDKEKPNCPKFIYVNV